MAGFAEQRMTNRGIKVAPEQGILGRNYPGKNTGNPYGPPGSMYLKKNPGIIQAIEQAWQAIFGKGPEPFKPIRGDKELEEWVKAQK